MGASWEEARRCPDDQSPGEIVGQQYIGAKSGAPNGSKLITLVCKNTRCQYHETPFLVQINPDGTIPEPTMEREKFFPKHGPSQRARDLVRQIEEEQQASTKPGAEVRR